MNPPPSASFVRRDRPPRGPAPRKAVRRVDCTCLEQIPNIGASLAADLRLINIHQPGDLIGREPLALYQALCLRRDHVQDPCVLDTFIAAVDFMQGAAPLPWWHYTETRKQRYGRTGNELARLKIRPISPTTSPESAAAMP